MSIAALDSSGILKELAIWLSDHVPSQELIAALIGLASAVIDNVPLVAATMGISRCPRCAITYALRSRPLTGPPLQNGSLKRPGRRAVAAHRVLRGNGGFHPDHRVRGGRGFHGHGEGGLRLVYPTREPLGSVGVCRGHRRVPARAQLGREPTRPGEPSLPQLVEMDVAVVECCTARATI
eukprot:scaffold185_cov321-Prasinococcus_capsulatus_cf.AAC.10